MSEFKVGDIVRRIPGTSGTYRVGQQPFTAISIGYGTFEDWVIDRFGAEHDPNNLELVLDPTAVEDVVNHPSHYKTASGLEAIDVLEQFGLVEDGRLFNAGKYLLRAGKKKNNDELQDLKKAVWYLNRYINEHESTK